MNIPKEFKDSPFEYIEYLEHENEELKVLINDIHYYLSNRGIIALPKHIRDGIEQALKQK